MGKPSNKRIALIGFAPTVSPEEILALGRAMSDSANEFKAARKAIKTNVYAVDFTVRIFGDIEVGIAEKKPEQFESEKYLIAALAQLSPEKRKAVLSRPVVKRDTAAIVKAELQNLKNKRQKMAGAAKLTPHLTVQRSARDSHQPSALLDTTRQTVTAP